MTTDARIVKCPLRSLFIAVLVPWIFRIAVYTVTSGTLREHGHAAELGAFMMTADALGALLGLMGELTIRIQVCFVMPMPKENDAARPLEVEFDDSRVHVVGLDPVAVGLIDVSRTQARQRDRPRRQS